ncbi:MAG TPA: hypothetical protein VFW29_06375 [Solirubrobacteraceae bacterium]|nr:hypothetical protein [Solirubrobacteraceae bacterium]
MVMQEQARRLREPLQWGRAQKRALALALTLLAAAVLGLGAYALTSGGSSSRRDCVDVTFASTLGGATLKGCGAHARAICASGSFPRLADELSAACARAGFAYRRPR